MMKKIFGLFSLCLAICTCQSQANDTAIRQSLGKLGINVKEIQASPLPEIKTVITDNMVLYVTKDGRHMIEGPLYDISTQSPANLTFKMLAEKLQQFSDQMVVYKAPKQQYVVTVFTDITCGYCHKLHQQIADYNALGITVRYLAFPREGLTGKVARQMESVWCAEDKKSALDAAMKGKTPPEKNCSIEIGQHYQLGLLFGIQGTPAIILDDGTLIPGYQGPNELKQFLDKRQGK